MKRCFVFKWAFLVPLLQVPVHVSSILTLKVALLQVPVYVGLPTSNLKWWFPCCRCLYVSTINIDGFPVAGVCPSSILTLIVALLQVPGQCEIEKNAMFYMYYPFNLDGPLLQVYSLPYWKRQGWSVLSIPSKDRVTLVSELLQLATRTSSSASRCSLLRLHFISRSLTTCMHSRRR